MGTRCRLGLHTECGDIDGRSYAGSTAGSFCGSHVGSLEGRACSKNCNATHMFMKNKTVPIPMWERQQCSGIPFWGDVAPVTERAAKHNPTCARIFRSRYKHSG